MPYSDWLDLCVQTIAWNSMTGRDQYGSPQYGPATTCRGRRVHKQVRIPSKGGDPDRVAESTIWILGDFDVNYEDRVYVSGDPPPFPIVLDVTRYVDENGDYYTKVMMGKAQ